MKLLTDSVVNTSEVILTVSVVRVLDASHGAATEHHLILCERSGLIREDVLHLAEVLGDVQSSTLQVRVRLLVVQIHVLVDEVNLTDLHDLDGDEERDGDQHLRTRRNRGTSVLNTSMREKTRTSTLHNNFNNKALNISDFSFMELLYFHF